MTMIRKKSSLLTALLTMFTTLLLSSCGMAFEFDGETGKVIGLTLDREDVYVMEGDTFILSAQIYPYEVDNNALMFISGDEEIVAVNNDTIYAVAEGSTRVVAVSMSSQLTDTCEVHVLPHWERTVEKEAHDMTVYADVDIDGKAFNPNEMMLFAFTNDRCCGVGELREWQGMKYTLFRIWQDQRPEDLPVQMVYFGVYNKVYHTMDYFEQTIDFDGDSHGTLSDLFKMTIEKD